MSDEPRPRKSTGEQGVAPQSATRSESDFVWSLQPSICLEAAPPVADVWTLTFSKEMKTTSKISSKLLASLIAVSGLLLVALLITLFLARQSSSTHYNLSYLLWKSGLKGYEPSVALPGMIHDHTFRQNMVGISLADFEARFPSTFYEVKTPPPIAKPGQRYFINDYHQAQRDDGGFGFVWYAVFEGGRLVEIDISKG